MREGLVITGGTPPAGRVSLEQRSAWLVVAADSGLDSARQLAITPDALVGDMDSLADERLLEHYPNLDVVRYPRDKDATDTELALDYAWRAGCTTTTLIGGSGGRFDHTLALLALFERTPCPTRWVLEDALVTVVDANASRREYRAAADAGHLVSLFPVGGGPWRATSAGLRWTLDAVTWDRSRVGVSNEAVGGEWLVRAESGRFLIVEPESTGGVTLWPELR